MKFPVQKQRSITVTNNIHVYKYPDNLVVCSVLDYYREGPGSNSHQRLWSMTLHRAHGRSYSALI